MTQYNSASFDMQLLSLLIQIIFPALSGRIFEDQQQIWILSEGTRWDNQRHGIAIAGL